MYLQEFNSACQIHDDAKMAALANIANDIVTQNDDDMHDIGLIFNEIGVWEYYTYLNCMVSK